ncbi:carbohydrate kinase [Planctomycetes bacterium Pan216]|uniref:carbohydrate kinase n=1 Tax=Kolteria novifilia TaxID=2527975 RepID=UPI0011A1A1E3
MTKKLPTIQKSRRPIAVGAGLVALDAVVSADVNIPVRYWAGGTCGNVLTSLAFLGWNSQPVARLGTGAASDLLLDDLRRWKLSLRFIRVEPDGSTPIIVERIRRDANGHPRHSFSWRCLGCGAPFPGYKPELLSVAETISPKIKGAKAFFFDRLSAGTVLLAKAAAESGALVVFEPCSIGNPVLFRQAWEVAHIVKYSHERLSEFPEMAVESSPLLVIETLGDAGLRYRRRTKGMAASTWVELKSFAAGTLKDTAGAGDWCTAGLISKVGIDGFAGFAKASDRQLDEGIRFGQALAAWNCGFEGARGGMYAVSKTLFKKQVDQLLSGSSALIPMPDPAVPDKVESSSFCRSCDVSVLDTRKRKTKRG